jgi:predicted nucleic acid-binding protein
VATYTADAVALLVYLVDALPRKADRVFAEAEAGETVIQTPSTALAEVLFSVSRDKEVRGVELSGTPEDARQALVGNGPVSVAPDSDETMVEYAEIVDEFSIHDGLIVASHLAQGTTAIITADGVIRDSDAETVWD